VTDPGPDHWPLIAVTVFSIGFWTVQVLGTNPVWPGVSAGLLFKIVVGNGVMAGFAIWIMWYREQVHEHGPFPVLQRLRNGGEDSAE